MIYLDNIVFSLQKTGGISAVWYEHLKRLLGDGARRERLNMLEYDNARDNMFRNLLHIDSSAVETRSATLLRLKRYLNPSVSQTAEPMLFHSSYYRTCGNRRAANVTTVHDFTYEYYSAGLTKKVHCWQKHRAIRNSDLIICISQNTKRDLLKFLPDVSEDKIRVVYNGVGEAYFPLKDNGSPLNDNSGNEVQLPFSAGSFVLFVGARRGYKNFELAVDGIADTSLNMVVVGSPLSDEEQALLTNKLGSARYKYVGRICNAELNLLYNKAFCLLYPSSYEGFGIPVIEAQRAGCPAIAADSSAISEVAGDKTLLISELTADAIREKINILNNPQTREELVGLGLENARRFSWDNTYAETGRVYDEAFELLTKK